MENQNIHYLTPEQHTGLHKDIACETNAETQSDAQDMFVAAKNRLLDINQWNSFSPAFGRSVSLSDGHGKKADRHAKKGDYICIDTSGPVPGTGNTEWIKIEAIEYDDYPDDDSETIAMLVCPAKAPDPHTIQICSNATGTLVIERVVKKLMAYYHMRNDAVGNRPDEDGMTAERSWLSVPDSQWEDLISSFLVF